MDRIESAAIKELSGDDIEALLVTTSIARKSALYWLPKLSAEDGGSIDNFSRSTPMTKGGKIVAADAIGAYFGFLRAAVFAPVPGANAIIAGSVVLGAAQASIGASLP